MQYPYEAAESSPHMSPWDKGLHGQGGESPRHRAIPLSS
jgi:hypothetical protein